MKARTLAAACFVVGLAWPSGAWASPDAARHLEAAIEAYQARDYEACLREAEASFADTPSPNSADMIGRSRQSLGRRVAAMQAYREVLRLARLAPSDRRADYRVATTNATRELAVLESELSRLVIFASMGTTVTVAGEGPISMVHSSDRVLSDAYREPGETTLEITHADGHRETRKLQLLKGVTETLDLAPPRLTPVPTAAPAPTPERPEAAPARSMTPTILMATGFTIAGAFAIGGAATGGLSLDRANDLREQCGDDPCPADLRDEWETADNLATASTVTLSLAAAGAVLGVVGVALELSTPSHDVAFVLRPSWAGLSVDF
jgi:hypothetical protein